MRIEKKIACEFFKICHIFCDFCLNFDKKNMMMYKFIHVKSSKNEEKSWTKKRENSVEIVQKAESRS